MHCHLGSVQAAQTFAAACLQAGACLEVVETVGIVAAVETADIVVVVVVVAVAADIRWETCIHSEFDLEQAV